jgi:hypothetical protein
VPKPSSEMEKLWTRVSDMAGVPSVIGGRLLAELGRIARS